MSQGRSIFVSLGLLFLAGCGNGHLPVAPAKGQVLYHGKPLEFGSVMFQPPAGPPARGVIQPDGTFELSTYEKKDGAIIGPHKIRVACVESQRGRNGGAKPKLGDAPGAEKAYIPEKYFHCESSGLTAEVKANNEPFVLTLTD